MQITKPTVLETLIEGFNNADNPTDRFAYAAAVRAEVQKYADTLDKTILPLFQDAIVRDLEQKNSYQAARDKKGGK